jgi:hypothetical protein
MAIDNPRSGGVGADTYYGLEGDKARLAAINREQYFLKGAMGASKPGSKKYEDALEQFNKLEKEKVKIAARAKANKNKGTQKDLDKAKEDLQRAKDVGDAKAQKDAEDKIKALEEKLPSAGPKPKDSDGDGIPDNIDATPSTPTPKPGDKPVPTPTPTPGGNKGGNKGGDNKGGDKPLSDEEQRAQALDAANTDFSLPETIFNNVPSLKTLLNRYVKEDWTIARLRKEIRDDVWYRKNSKEIKERYVQLYNYRDMVASGQADGSTNYEKEISTLERQLADKARLMGSGIASDPAALRKAAENMYITNVGIDDAMTTDFIAAAIRPIGSTIGGKPTSGYSGKALQDYQELQSIAKKNGFKISDIVPGAATEQQVLQGIATGRLDPNRIAQDARKLAAQGQPQYVRDLLGQGYDLEQIYSPYRQTMANILEVNADQIDLNDQTLRSAITDKGDMNIYDFKRQLKKDDRWQYTENAKREVSGATMKVLRDFGFQG